ncbi:MAG: TfuA-like protein [Acidobacteriota bacterium]
MKRSAVVVFAGPSLHGVDAAGRPLLERCAVWAPAGRGDILRALSTQPRALVLIDGYFHRVPAVTHQELLYALDAGVPVFGASSMGALRAVELERFGMTGVGRIFAAYRDGLVDGDDEVALLHAPAEYGYAPIGVALVEVRFALEGIQPEVANELSTPFLRALKTLGFSERTQERVARLARKHLGEALAARLFVALEASSVKREDGLAAVAEALASAGPRPPRRRPATGYLSCFKELYIEAPNAGAVEPGKTTVARALQAALVLHAQAPAFVRAMRLRAARVAAARDQSVPRDALATRTAELRRQHEMSFGSAFLPAAEYSAEAEVELQSEHGKEDGTACAAAKMLELARRFGCEVEAAGAEAAMLAVFEAQPDLLPSWDLARAFAFSPAFGAACRTAAAALEVLACLLRSRDGARIDTAALREFAAEQWNCAPQAVASRASARGLFPAAGLADGLREALELFAPAERLPQAINGYPAARAALRAGKLLF